MLDPETTAIVTGATGNIIAYMLNGRVDAVREWFSRIFRSEEEVATQLRVITEDRRSLAKRETSESELKAKWGILLASYLVENRDALLAMKALSCASEDHSGSMIVDQQRNEGAGVFIGRDMSGNITWPGGSS